MVRTQVSFDPAMYREARREARRLGISFAELCRRAIARAIATPAASARGPREQDDKPWMRLLGTLHSGDPDASSSVDAVVYGRDRP